MRRLHPGWMLALPVALVLLSSGEAAAGCVGNESTRMVARSIERAVRCTLRKLERGPDASCREVPSAPACAGTLVNDALALAFGPDLAPAAGADRKALRSQLRCQRAIGRGVSRSVAKRMRGLTRGRSSEEVDAAAGRQLRKVAKRCGVPPAEDARGVVLPAVGPQCAAAIDTPGGAADAETLRSCLHTLLGVWGERVGPAPQPLRPNIVFILTDDQRWDTLDATHSPDDDPVMPYTLAALRDEGVNFPQAFLTTPLCCPSRASILSGQYAHNSGVYTNKGPEEGDHGGADDFDDTSTMGVWLQGAGYRTGFYGKYMNKYKDLWDRSIDEPPYVPPGWSEWHAFRNPKFFDYWLVERSGEGTAVESRYGSADADYSTDVLRRMAVEFIDSTPEDQPFFLYLNFKAPHLPRTPAPRHDGTFHGLAPWRPPSHNEPDVSDKPTWVQEQIPFEGLDLLQLDFTRIKQLEMLQAIDEAIDGPESFGTRSIMQALRDRGIADDTIVIFLSDNGWLWGEHRMWKKSKPYEEAIRSPLLVRYPKLAPLPRQEEGFALNIDLAPTLVELAGAIVSPPLAIDGSSLVGLLDGTAPDWRSDFLTEGWPAANSPWATVRERRWKYTELPVEPGSGATTFERELYDLSSDPYELDNLADDPAHADRVDSMSLRLRELRPLWPLDSTALEEDPNE